MTTATTLSKLFDSGINLSDAQVLIVPSAVLAAVSEGAGSSSNGTDATALHAADNLASLTDKAAARTNLGVLLATTSLAGLAKGGKFTETDADGSIHARIAARYGGVYNAVIDGGADNTGVTNTATLLISGWIASQVLGMRFYLPAGTYNVGANTVQLGGAGLWGVQNAVTGLWTYTTSSTAGAVALSGRVDVFGIPGRTVLTTTSTSAIIMRVGNGSQLADGVAHHAIHGLKFVGPGLASDTPSPLRTGGTGLLIDAGTHALVTKCQAGYLDAGFDMNHNCYGAHFLACRIDRCNVSAVLRGVSEGGANAGCGNQIVFDDCWFGAEVASFYIGVGADGIVIRNGQAGSHATDGADNCATVVWGKEWLSQATGGSGTILIDNVDQEGFWGRSLRGFGPANVTMKGCPIISYGGDHPAQGIVKIDSFGSGTLRLEMNSVRGAFLDAVAVSINGYGFSTLVEEFTFTDNSTFAGVPCVAQSLFVQSKLTYGFSRYRGYGNGGTVGGDITYQNGTFWTVTSTGPAFSTDGLSWQKVATTAQLASLAPSPSSPTYLAALPAVAAAGGPFAAYDASLIKGASGAAVPSLHDLSGWGNTVTETTAARQPTFNPTGINSKGAIRFNAAGSNTARASSLVTPNALNLPQEFLTPLGGSDFTMLFVGTPMSPVPGASSQGVAAYVGTADGQNAIMSILENYTVANAYAMRATNGNLVFPNNGPVTAGTVAKLIITYVAATGVLSLYVDAQAAQTTTVAANTAVWNSLAFGYSFTPNQYTADMLMGEAVFWAGVPTAAELTALKSYAKNKWGGS